MPKYITGVIYGNDENDGLEDVIVLPMYTEAPDSPTAIEKFKEMVVQMELEDLASELNYGGSQDERDEKIEEINRINSYRWDAIRYNEEKGYGYLIDVVINIDHLL